MHKPSEIDFSTLKIISKQLSMEGYAQEGLVGDFAKYVSNIFNAFRHTGDLLEVKGFAHHPDQIPLSKENKRFINTVNSVAYADLMMLSATVPEGMSCTYLEMLEPLLETSEYLKGIQAHVVQPYSLYLASFLSNENTSLSTETKRFEYKKLEDDRDARLNKFSKLYDADSYNTKTTVGKVISRNADWQPALGMLQKIISNLEAVNRRAVKKEIDTCVDYLALISDSLKRNKTRTSPEAAERLSLGAYQVAKEMEYFSISYYRALGLSAAIESTMEHITNVYG
jgi:hypothetical protein